MNLCTLLYGAENFFLSLPSYPSSIVCTGSSKQNIFTASKALHLDRREIDTNRHPFEQKTDTFAGEITGEGSSLSEQKTGTYLNRQYLEPMLNLQAF